MSKTTIQAAYKGLLQRGRLVPDPHQAALVSRLAKLQNELLETNNAIQIPTAGQKNQAPRGLYIHGTVGTGKSRLADLFASTLPPAITCRRSHFFEFMMDIHSRLHQARSQPGYAGDPLVQIGKTICSESRVLCFDEFQVTDIADAMILSRLFGSIWREGGVMVSTSNRHPDDLYENGLNRDLFLPFIRQVKDRCEVWEIGGREDYRMRSTSTDDGGGRSETFFTDKKLFQDRRAETLAGRRLERVSIPVYGSRTLEVNAVPADQELQGTTGKRLLAVSGTFEELCEASLGSGDYHGLCSATDTIFLSGLRKFRAGEKDSVRRLITLIDLAYETRARVICLSSVPLNEIFAQIVASERKSGVSMTVKGEGGASSSMMSTFIGETEWSATGLSQASLATGGAGETDVGFAVGRAISRLYEMGSKNYGVQD